MWLMIMYDLPSVSMKQKSDAKKFRKELIKDGFTMFQQSVYVRHCFSRNKTEIHKIRIKKLLINNGKVSIMQFTDKQFIEIENFTGRKINKITNIPELLMFI